MDDVLKRHPWNVDFRWSPPPGGGGVLDHDQLQQFDRDGFIVIDALIDSKTLDTIASTIDDLERATEEQISDDERSIAAKGVINFAQLLVARSDRLRRFAADPRLVDLCLDLIGPDVDLYWDQAVYKRAERPRRFPWHQDNGYTFVEPQQYLTVWLALNDATVDNGCPQVVPGVHRAGTLAHHFVDRLGYECFAEPEDVVAAPVAAGGAVVFSSLTPHLTGPNVAGGVRKAYIVQYAPSGLQRLVGDPRSGPPTERQPCNDPTHQFAVARGGRRVVPTPT